MARRRSRNRKKPVAASVRKPPSEPEVADSRVQKEQEELAGRAQARGDLYEIFSLVFQEAPSPEFLAVFRHSDFLQIVRLLLSAETLAKWERFAAGKMPLNHLQARLRLEYNNLFLVPTSQRVVPRESAFFHEPGQPQAVQKRVEDIQKYFRRIGMNPLTKFKEEPDHLSQVMHFMSVLCEREKDYLQKNNLAQLEQTCQIERDFLAKHLLEWIPRLRERMHRATRFLFFRDVAELMEEFVIAEAEWTTGLPERYGVKKRKEAAAQGTPAKKTPAKKRPAKAAAASAAAGEAKRPRKRRRGGHRRRSKKSESARSG